MAQVVTQRAIVAVADTAVPAGEPPAPVPVYGPDGSDGAFARQVRDALRHLYDPVYLQTHPLTRFLRQDGAAGPAGKAAPPAAGTALRRCLLDAIAALQPPAEPPAGARGGLEPGSAQPAGAGRTAWRRYRLLVLRYVDGQDILAVCGQLAISRREYERQHRQSLQAIVSLLGTRWTGNGAVPAAAAATAASPAGEGQAPESPATLRLLERRGPVGGAPEPARGRLPHPLTSLVGRAAESVAVTRLLQHARLVTLTGPAGVGKTRLALEVAARLESLFPDGAAFVPLAAVAEPGLVPAAIAHAIGVRETPGTAPATPVERLGEVLRHQRLLLVLDNYEHLPDAAPLVPRLLAMAEGLSVLVTSRAALRVSGEQEYAVPPLTVPEAVPAQSTARPPEGGRVSYEDIAGADAVRLFAERARAISPEFSLTPETAPAVAGICRRLDGLPLAIELAAARVRLFSPPALLARLESAAGGLPLLTGGPCDAPARHQTLRAAIAWSYDLLTIREQALLRRLAVFAGGFGLDAARAIVYPPAEGAEPGASPAETRHTPDADGAVVDVLAGLVAKSLVRRDPDVAGEPRFGLLETVREFCLERLEAGGEAGAAREGHARFYASLAQIPDTEFGARWLDAIEREQENLRAAVRWCMGRGNAASAARGLHLAAALARLWSRRGQLSQGQAELAWALAWPEPVEPTEAYWWVRATLLTKAGHLARWRADFPASQRAYEAGLALRRRTGQRNMLPYSLGSLGGLALDRGDLATARACFQEALALQREQRGRHLCAALRDMGLLAQEEGDDAAARRYLEEGLALAQAHGELSVTGACHNELGRLLWRRGQPAAARTQHEAALAVAGELGDKGGSAAALDHLGRTALALGEVAEARRRHTAALEMAWEFGDRLRVAWCLVGLAAVVAAQDQGRQATRLLGAAAALRQTLGAPVLPSQRPWYERQLAAARAALPAAVFATTWNEGQAAPLAALVTACLGTHG
ncbi:MAG TPA: tetratricopeptide repeat protein [Chloroflexota bacterium]|nr:tetratricopeptide repeat protein [Chloroflexota bacterium]